MNNLDVTIMAGERPGEHDIILTRQGDEVISNTLQGFSMDDLQSLRIRLSAYMKTRTDMYNISGLHPDDDIV